MRSQTVQDIPGIQPAVVPVGEHRANRVVADRFDAQDIHIALADLQGFLPRRVSARFGGRGKDTQELVTQLETLTVVKTQLQQTRALMQSLDQWSALPRLRPVIDFWNPS